MFQTLRGSSSGRQYTQFLCGMFFMHLNKQSSKRKSVYQQHLYQHGTFNHLDDSTENCFINPFH